MGLILLLKVPDGLEYEEDHNNLGKLTESISNVTPGCLEELIQNNKKTEMDRLACFIEEENMVWALDMAPS